MTPRSGIFRLEREVIAAGWRNKGLWLLQVGGNAVLAGIAYAWLWIPDRTPWHLVESALLGLGLVAAVFWLHGATFARFLSLHREGREGLGAALRRAGTHIPALTCWAVVSGLTLGVITGVGTCVPGASARLASAATLALRRPVSPMLIGGLGEAFIHAAVWFFAPAFLLPLALQSAEHGLRGMSWKGLRTAWSIFRRGRYWLDFLLLLVLGSYVPTALLRWVPEAESLASQAPSLALRLLLAYATAVTAWIFLASLLGRLSVEARPGAETTG